MTVIALNDCLALKSQMSDFENGHGNVLFLRTLRAIRGDECLVTTKDTNGTKIKPKECSNRVSVSQFGSLMKRLVIEFPAQNRDPAEVFPAWRIDDGPAPICLTAEAS